jgi:hypothetical protein
VRSWCLSGAGRQNEPNRRRLVRAMTSMSHQ